MNVKCPNCGRMNNVPSSPTDGQFRCYQCGSFLPKRAAPAGETSAAVGLIGGAALGAAIGGPVGAMIGAIVGAVIGSEAKGVG